MLEGNPQMIKGPSARSKEQGLHKGMKNIIKKAKVP